MDSFELERGRIFVGGLHWQALTGGASEAKAEALRLASELSFDLAVWRTTGAQQIGFAATADGFKAGMLSAAAVVSKTIEVESGERDFLCATKLPDGRYLYVAQAEGVIPPDGDFIASAEDVRARMLEDLSIGKNWNMVIAPLMWAMSNTVERDFEDFIPQKGGKPDFKHSWWALKPVKPSLTSMLKGVAPFLIAGLVLAGAAVGYKQYQQQQAAQEAARLAAMQASEPVQELPHPWKDKVRAKAAIQACSTAINGLETLWPGNWKPESVACSVATGTLTVTWKQGAHGWIKHLLEVEPRASVIGDGTTAILVLPVPMSGAEDEALLDERTRSLDMRVKVQQYGATLVLAAPPAPPAMPGANANQAPSRWNELSWAMQGVLLPPEDLISSMDGAGFRLGSVTARFTDGLIKWDLEGSQYVLP